MLRSIADIARSEAERIKDMEAKLARLEVFALVGPSERDDTAEAGYFAARAALTRMVSEAAQFIAQRGLAREAAPVRVRLTRSIPGRFGTVALEKLAAQAIPVIGAVGGALISTLFIDRFQDVARGHFTVRRLEREYGVDEVRLEYERLQTRSRSGASISNLSATAF